MEASKKVIDFVKRSFSNLTTIVPLSREQSRVEPMSGSLEWSDANETRIIKKTEYESLNNELYEKTEIIKKFKIKEDEYQSLIRDYESTLNSIIKTGEYKQDSFTKTNFNLVDKYESELCKLKASEDRLKSHIQALKRDLVIAEEKLENIEDKYEQEQIFLQAECEATKDLLKQEIALKNKAEFENRELKNSLEKRCAEIAELIEYCRYLAN